MGNPEPIPAAFDQNWGQFHQWKRWHLRGIQLSEMSNVDLPRSLRGLATSILTGAAAIATVVGAILAALAQFGYLGTPKPAPPTVIFITPVALASPTAAAIARAPSEEATHASKAQSKAASVHPHRVPPTELASIPPENPLAVPNPIERPSLMQPVAKPNRLSSLSGAWRDYGIGACHAVIQTGHELDITHYDPVTGEVMGRAIGTVDGIYVHIQFGKSSNTADLHLTGDGRHMIGIFYKIDGPHHGQWSYLGPKCPAPSEQASLAVASPVPSEPVEASSASPDNLSGAWRDGKIGACHLVRQIGNHLDITNYSPTTNQVIGHASGSIDGGHVQLAFRNGTADLHLTADRRTLLGTFVRPGGTGHGQWSYLGPGCPGVPSPAAAD
jgi:hypothetical protein